MQSLSSLFPLLYKQHAEIQPQQPSPQSSSIQLPSLSVIPAYAEIDMTAVSLSVPVSLSSPVPVPVHTSSSSSSSLLSADPLPFCSYSVGMEQQTWVHHPNNMWRITCFSMLMNTLLLIGSISVLALFVISEQDTVDRWLWCGYAIFISTRYFTNILLAVWRYKQPTLWINQHTQLHPASIGQKIVYWIKVVFLVLSVVALGGLFVYFLMVHFNDTENNSSVNKWYLSILSVEFTVLITPLVIYTYLVTVWTFKSISWFLPFIPINYTALQHFGHYHQEVEKNGGNGLSKQVLSHLPIAKYHHNLLPDRADKTCPICLTGFKEREKVRILHCQHTYHQACVDPWLKRRGTCPLCVRVVAPAADVNLHSAALVSTSAFSSSMSRLV